LFHSSSTYLKPPPHIPERCQVGKVRDRKVLRERKRERKLEICYLSSLKGCKRPTKSIFQNIEHIQERTALILRNTFYI
jgi:hypothetical protein